MYGEMYPEHIPDDEGEQAANPASITKKKEGKQRNSSIWRFFKVRLECRKFECMKNETTWRH